MKEVLQSKKFWSFVLIKLFVLFLMLGAMLAILIATFDTYRDEYFVQINIEERNLQQFSPSEPSSTNLAHPNKEDLKKDADKTNQ